MLSRRLLVGVVIVLSAVGGGAGVALADFDDDGVANVDELQHGTAVLEADSDGDGIDDGAEVNQYGTDPHDSDSDDDGLTDGPEVNDYGTDPTAADTDGDGLDDRAELDEHDTDPTDSDTDDDGLSDADELREHDTDPDVADTDADGLVDGAEVHEHGTDPTERDTDGDGLDDAEEVRKFDTDPTAVDTDGDGLNDHAEVRRHGTDPLAADTDSDGLDDGPEVGKHETDPTDSDTDSDGLPDGTEVHNKERFPNADPLQTDVYVEMDWMNGAKLPEDEAEEIEASFADAPVSNPDGSTGIDLHFVESDEVPAQDTIEYSIASNSVVGEYQSQYFDNAGYGYHYLLLVKGIDDDDVAGFSARGTNVVSYYDYPDVTGHRTMHELGHSLGLSPRDFEGIDSRTYDHHEYPSVMNYNREFGQYDYSDGTAGPNDFDDWGHIEQTLRVPNRSKIKV